ncbi:MAG: GNAT family N-acetyltransferase [Myxococcota bacterium]
MHTFHVSGHRDLDPVEFEVHYLHQLEAALGDRFVVGDAPGADAIAHAWLHARGGRGVVYHIGASPRFDPRGWPTRGGFTSDEARDAAMTADSDLDLAWVRPGRERSGTAQNLARRPRHPAEVVLAGVEDWARVRSLRLTALADAPDAFGSTFAGERGLPESTWRARLARAEARTLLGRIDGRDAGLVVVAPADAPGDLGLYSVWVSPTARGRGLGDALVAEAVTVARDLGFRRLVLDVGDANAPAIALYARHGFAPTGVRGSLPPPREHVPEHQRARRLVPR